MVELDFTGSLAPKRNVVSSMTFHANCKLAEWLGKDPVLSPQEPRLHWWELLAGSWLQSVSTALAARWPCSEKCCCSLCISMLVVSCHLLPAGAWVSVQKDVISEKLILSTFCCLLSYVLNELHQTPAFCKTTQYLKQNPNKTRKLKFRVSPG